MKVSLLPVLHIALLSLVGCAGGGSEGKESTPADGEAALVGDTYGLCGRYAYGQFGGSKEFSSQVFHYFSGWADGAWNETEVREGIGSSSRQLACTEEGILMLSSSSTYYGDDGGTPPSECTATYDPGVLIWQHGASVGTQWSSTSTSTIECDGAEPLVSETEQLQKVVAEGPFETDAGTFETVALEVAGTEYLQWISEGLGVIGLSDEIEYLYPKRQLIAYELDSD